MNTITNTWTCTCGETVNRYRGSSTATCRRCDQPYNACGQRLRRDWAANPSTWDDEISDLEGYEIQHAGE